MLNKLKRRLRRFPVKDNIQPLLASSSATGLPEASVDFIFAANVFEEIAKEGELEATVRELYRLLKADGVLFFGEHRIPQTLLNNILNELEKAGFKLKQKLDNLFFAAALYQK
jgi:ubiquinone/menaquinone biosynthesis C-methylase UbiE